MPGTAWSHRPLLYPNSSSKAHVNTQKMDVGPLALHLFFPACCIDQAASLRSTITQFSNRCIRTGGQAQLVWAARALAFTLEQSFSLGKQECGCTQQPGRHREAPGAGLSPCLWALLSPVGGWSLEGSGERRGGMLRSASPCGYKRPRWSRTKGNDHTPSPQVSK